jgi:ribosomal protein S18 acetylase RimI-like enzyme
MTDATQTQIRVRQLRSDDLPEVVALDALLTGEAKDAYWSDIFERFLLDEGCIGLAATDGQRLRGYLFGEQRAFEFGSKPCGWIFAVGVHRDAVRSGVASALLEEACSLFRALGVSAVRTMVPRTDVPFLSFFRRNGFVGGPFVQLELGLSSSGDDLEQEP